MRQTVDAFWPAKPIWDTAIPAHCAHTRHAGPLSLLLVPHGSSCRVFFGSEKQRPPLSPGPPLPQSNWLPLPLTAPEQQPGPRPRLAPRRSLLW